MLPTYSRNDEHFPRGLCSTCNSRLDRLIAGTVTSIPVSVHLGTTVVPPQTRARISNNDCQCVICFRAKLNGGQWVSFKAQVKKKTGPLVDHKLCPSCFSKVYCFQTWKLDFLDYACFDWLTKNKQEQEYQFQPN